MNIFVIAPHPDDEAIGCGGTMCLHAERGDRVVVVFLTSGELGLKHLSREVAWHVREAEAEAAAAILGVARLTFLRYPDWYVNEHVEQTGTSLRAVLEKEMPKMIYLPHAGEWHPDHQAALPVLLASGTRFMLPEPELLTYEVWNPLTKYNQVMDITGTMARKLQAVRCYQSQLAGFRYDRAVKGLNQYRGILAARCRYAEVFERIPEGIEGPRPG